MEITLTRASVEDAVEIHSMQLAAFKRLLEKYRDFDISPGAEPIEKVIERLRQSFSHYYLIKLDGAPIGAIRIILKEEGALCRISPVFILPEFQGRGFGQRVFREIEKLYSPERGWELDTILEEAGNCRLYEKLGYRKTSQAP